MIIPIKYKEFVITEYYYFCQSIFNAKLDFVNESVYWFDKLICKNKEFYNGFPKAVYSFEEISDENNARIYYLCG